VNSVGENPAEAKRVLSTLPNHGRLPIVMRFNAEASPALVGHLRVTVPAGAFADLPGLGPMLLDQFGARLAK
jgi:hypothetical protein